MTALTALRRLFGSTQRSTQLLAEVQAGFANLSETMERGLGAVTAQAAGMSRILPAPHSGPPPTKENDIEFARAYLRRHRPVFRHTATWLLRGLAGRDA